MGGLTGLWLARFAGTFTRWRWLIPQRGSAISRAGFPAPRGASGENGCSGCRRAADRWFSDIPPARREVVEALCHQLTHSDAEGYAACCEALAAAADLRGGRANCDSVLIIAGESDPVTTVADANFHQQIADSQVVVLSASHLSNIAASRLCRAERLFAGSKMEDKQRYQQGMEVRRKVLGDAHVDRTLQNLTPLNEEFQDFITVTPGRNTDASGARSPYPQHDHYCDADCAQPRGGT